MQKQLTIGVSKKRAPGQKKNYVMVAGQLRCRKCRGKVEKAIVRRPIHIRGTRSGGGETKREIVPFCPRCDKEPGFTGPPVYEKF